MVNWLPSFCNDFSSVIFIAGISISNLSVEFQPKIFYGFKSGDCAKNGGNLILSWILWHGLDHCPAEIRSRHEVPISNRSSQIFGEDFLVHIFFHDSIDEV